VGQDGILRTDCQSVHRRLSAGVCPCDTLRIGVKEPSETSEADRLARYRLFQVSAQILEDLLLALLDFEQDRLRHSSVVLPRMDLARLQEDSPQIGDRFLREQHLVIGLNHRSSSSTIPRFRKLLEV